MCDRGRCKRDAVRHAVVACDGTWDVLTDQEVRPGLGLRGRRALSCRAGMCAHARCKGSPMQLGCLLEASGQLAV